MIAMDMPYARRIHEWLRPRLFASPLVSLSTVLLTALLVLLATRAVNWGVVQAMWRFPLAPDDSPDTTACIMREVQGACWAVIADRYRFLLFGYYPFAEQWRAAAATAIVLALCGLSAIPSQWRRRTLWLWAAGGAAALLLMAGGALGLSPVSQERWGGLPLVLLTTIGTIFVAVPLGVVIALGRTARQTPLVRTASSAYVELFRGIPLVTVLFISSIMLPMFLPESWVIPKLLRAQIAICLFTTAYLSEVIRSGLAAVPAGQHEAANALGLSPFVKLTKVTLPQALVISIPGLVNGSVGLVKNTSVLSIIGLFDLTLTTQTVLSDPNFAPYYVELYAFIAAIYAVFCFTLSRYSRFLERRFRAGRR